MMVTIKGGHAPVSLRGSRIEGGMLEVVVVSTSERGMVNSSSSSAMSSFATGNPNWSVHGRNLSQGKLTSASTGILRPKILQLDLGIQPRTIHGSEPCEEIGGCLIKVQRL